MRREEFGEQFASTLTDEQMELLKRLHEDIGWSCAAHSEGLDCCVDVIEDARRAA